MTNGTVKNHRSYQPILDFFEFMDKNQPNCTIKTEQQLVTVGLLEKVYANAICIPKLLEENALEASIILLRVMYESSLYMNYFLFEEKDIQLWRYVSFACQLRNLVYLRDSLLLTKSDSDPSIIEINKNILNHQNVLLDSYLLKDKSLSPDNLNSKKSINNHIISNFPSVENMKNYLDEKELPIYISLRILHTRFYNETSELIHPNYRIIKEFYIDRKPPLFNLTQILSAMAHVLKLTLYPVTETGLVSYEFQEAVDLLNKVIKISDFE